MSIEVSNESGIDVSEEELISVARFVIAKMDVNPAAELSMVLLDTAAMADLHMRWMDLPGPTDVMSFPMDELEPGGRPDAPEPGPSMLGDIVLCPEFAAKQAADGRAHARSGTGAADGPRCAAPARLRPCRTGRGKGDVRPAAPATRGVGRRPGRGLPPGPPDREGSPAAGQVPILRRTVTGMGHSRRDRAGRLRRIVRGHRRRDRYGVDRPRGGTVPTNSLARRGWRGDRRASARHQSAAPHHL